VWKRENMAADEKRKLDELTKQYEDERAAQELAQIAHDAGYKCVLGFDGGLLCVCVALTACACVRACVRARTCD
jgi:hypothetical protein